MEKKLNFKVCGLPAKYFIPFFIIVMGNCLPWLYAGC